MSAHPRLNNLRKWIAAKIWTPPMPTPWQRFREAQLDIEEYKIFHDVPDPVPDIQEAARTAWEKCATHPRPGELLMQFNRIKQASAPMAPLPPMRQTEPIVRRPLAVESNPTLLPARYRQNSEPINLEELRTFPTHEKTNQAEIAAIPTLHGLTEDVMPDWAQKPGMEDEWLNSHNEQVRVWAEPDRSQLFNDVRMPSQPLAEDSEPTALHERTIRNRNFQQAITGLLGNGESA